MGCGCFGYVKKIWKNGKQYTQAVLKWTQAGRPKRTAKEIEQRFEMCKKCENFKPIQGRPWRGRCGVCGCYLGRHANKLIIGNKIAMKTEKCPIGKWE